MKKKYLRCRRPSWVQAHCTKINNLDVLQKVHPDTLQTPGLKTFSTLSKKCSFIYHKNFGTFQACLGNPDYTFRGKGTCLYPYQGGPRCCSALWSRGDTHPDELMVLSHLSGSPFRLWGSLLRRMGCRGKAFQDSTRLIMGCLGEEPKVRKGVDLGDLGTHMGKQRKKWIKGLFANIQIAVQCSFMTMHSAPQSLLYVTEFLF